MPNSPFPWIDRLTKCLLLLLSSTGAAENRELDRPVKSASESPSVAKGTSDPAEPTFAELKAAGARRSSYLKFQPRSDSNQAPQPQLAVFRDRVQPILEQTCVQCHGPDAQEGNIRIDTLDPDLLHGDDVDWWLEIAAVLTNGEMPPPDEAELSDDDRSQIVEWLTAELQTASRVRRAELGHSSFRRMTRYEYNYALQDLLALPYDFARDLPPESNSEDGFQNSSDMLHMSNMQFAAYRELSRRALDLATVRGERPSPIYWSVSMQAAAGDEWTKQDEELEKIRQKFQDKPEQLELELKKRTAQFQSRPNGPHYKHLITGRTVRATWNYRGARYAWQPSPTPPDTPEISEYVAVIPPRQKLIVELGNQVPERGLLRVRVRASRLSPAEPHIPSLQLEFGWQASNDSSASVRISPHDLEIDAPPEAPRFYEWRIPLSEVYPRNLVRTTAKMGELPNPSEFVKLVNSSDSRGDIQIDYVEIAAPVFNQWPPESHERIFIESGNRSDETLYAREILAKFMSRAWRRRVGESEIDQKLALFRQVRPVCNDFQAAMLEVLSTVLSSPKFLYLVRSDSSDQPAEASARIRLNDSELATRLSMFLWCSLPDDELLELAHNRQLHRADVLSAQVERMLADPRSNRFSRQFVRQWLGMQLLDYLRIDPQAYPQFDASLKEAMQEEPRAFFHEVLQNDHSVLDFLHADYTVVNERLARHYELGNVYGNHFRRVPLKPQHRRGGLLTQAGLLAMNSDGKDSHPLKRGIWMLENLLNDPPPPPPPAVPEIDLADPEIAKLTLKQRIENHRNQAACMSCHAKIDPWGIAFENFDAVGLWRTEIQGQPVDASSQLFNQQKLDGMRGLKQYLLANRQDQFVRAMVHKMATYALGRPLTFGDRSSVDQITVDLRQQGDGLATMVKLIATSELFQAP